MHTSARRLLLILIGVPGCGVCANNLASVILNSGSPTPAQMGEVEALVPRAIVLKPAYDSSYNTLGTILASRRDEAGAEAAFKHAMELAPDRVASAANLAALYARNGRYGDALPLLRSARVKDPKNPVLRANLGFALRDQGSVEAWAGRLVEAVAFFQEASRVTPDDADLHRNFGLALWEQGEHEAVALHLERAAQLRPADESIRGLLERLRTDPGRVPALR